MAQIDAKAISGLFLTPCGPTGAAILTVHRATSNLKNTSFNKLLDSHKKLD
jgi:hypothetical protein